MKDSRQAEAISASQLQSCVAAYHDTVTDKIQKVETACRETIPESLKKRIDHGEPYLTKGEVQELLKWKL